ncbi:uncharacterized protein [Watersipora subatra]|uniref:uncharacterized protein n=1 Tax=Watersipora subatra TaxID=2589382 RepID=UPI00355C55B0
MTIDHYLDNQTYLLVDNCAESAATMFSGEQCDGTNFTDGGGIPVTNLYSGVTFRNIFCAHCNNETELVKWDAVIKCETASNSRPSGECTRYVIKPPLVSLKPCSKTDSHHKKIKRTKRTSQAKHKHQDFPEGGYTMLLNFGVDGNAHSMYKFDADQYQYSQKQCTDSQIFNPFEQECIDTSCRLNYISIKGKCVHQREVQRDELAACVDFSINYSSKDSMPAVEEELLKRGLFDAFMKEYNISFHKAVLPFKPYDNKSQCLSGNAFDNSYGSWNMSEINELVELESESSWQPHSPGAGSPTCINMTEGNRSQTVGSFVVSLRFNYVASELQGIQQLLNDTSYGRTFSIFEKRNNLTAYGCVSSATLQNVSQSWCQGIKHMYFNDQFDVLSSGSNGSITGIKVPSTNRTYLISQFLYTKVISNGTSWKNVTQMVSTCDSLPSIRNESCLRLLLQPHSNGLEQNGLWYEQLPNRSIIVKQFQELYNTKFPFQSSPSKSIQSVFDLDEYVYVWSQSENYAETEDALLYDQPVSICMPEGLLLWFLEFESWNSINIENSCSFLQTFGWASSITGFICSMISIIAMVLVLVTYSIFKTLRTLPGISLMNLTVAVMLSQVSFLTGVLMTPGLEDKNYACFTSAVFTHFFTLSSFMWMNVMAYSSYKAFGADLKTQMMKLNRKNMLFNSLYGWGMPALIVIICAIIDYVLRKKQLIAYGVVSDVKVSAEKNATTGFIDAIEIRYQTMSTCWIGNSKAAVVIFGVPLLYSIVVNLSLFIKTCIGMKKWKGGHQKTILRRNSANGRVGNRNEMAIHLRLSAQYGFAWIFAIMIIIIGTSQASSDVICYILYIINLIFNILNGCTGLFIFFAFIFNKRILHLYKAKISQFNSRKRDKNRTNARRVSSSVTSSTISSAYSTSTSQLD